MPTTTLGRIRIIALIEGVSFLVLLFIAMPLKYIAEIPMAVKIVGWAHGALFVALCLLLAYGLIFGVLRFGKATMVFVAALLPFGPFVIERKLRDPELDSTSQ